MGGVAKKFNTMPVFFTAISTILGAIMFLRFGFAVGQLGFLGTIVIIVIGHLVTIPTAMAIAEIATNQKVEGGGEYYIISRSFGLVIGSTIGITLYLSQAISVAFYIIAFSEAFTPLFQWIDGFHPPAWVSWLLAQKQTIGIPALLGLTYIMLTKGASLGVKTLYIVVATLGVALVAFFIGTTAYQSSGQFDATATVLDFPESGIAPVDFFTVFAIIFPAFTGMTAGVGLSGDLKDPGKSLPLGTLSATLAGMVIYLFIAYKLAIAASPVDLADTSRLVMSDIAWQGHWLIPIGLAAATISSALGSIMVAPRTLQAISRDRIFPTPFLNDLLSKGKGASDEPFNASLITFMLAAAFILMGQLDGVAQVISMFFMVTYGSLCLISFLNHFAADPSYRPSFRSRWYISLFGAIVCFGLMFFMNASYALLAILLLFLLYFIIAYFNKDKKSIALIFQGAIFQFSRQMQVFLQKADKEAARSWRPSVVALSKHTFDRIGPFDLLRWIAHKYGFGTYIHFIPGYLSRQLNMEAKAAKNRLIRMAEISSSKIYIDTMISPSYQSAIAQIIQLPGMAGTDNNLLLLEYSRHDPEGLTQLIDNFNLIRSVDFDLAILASSDRGFGIRKRIHIWITQQDYRNANLMILLAYILMGHKEWAGAEPRVFAYFTEDMMEQEQNRLLGLIQAGQLPISAHNVVFLKRSLDTNPHEVIIEKSRDADLTLIGFLTETVKKMGARIFTEYDLPGNILFISSAEEIELK
ncbi:MAG: amino acid permease [Saprospiraceae bacterium]|nr:amino acid permease [Saprospiraceae bacterium]